MQVALGKQMSCKGQATWARYGKGRYHLAKAMAWAASAWT